MKRVFLLCYLFMLSLSVNLFAEELYVEGVIMEKDSPQTSIAIINGEPLTTGATVGDYKISEIQEDQVILVASDGTLKKLGIVGKPSPEALPLEPDKEEVVRYSPLAEERDMIGEIEKKMEDPKFNFADLISFAQYARTQANMRNVQTAAMVYFSDFGVVPTIKQLVKEGFLNPEYEDGEHFGYVFKIRSQDGEPTIFAEPSNPASKKRSFLIDKWGNLKSYRADSRVPALTEEKTA